jgi:peptidoglycan/xylan/chitin deacetylase (PgdA/CDA1 family)
MGAHTVNHVDLGHVHGAEAEREIVESKDRLESELGAQVTQFSYPYGRLDTITAANRDVVRRAGFDCCFSAYGGAIARGADVFNLQRAPVTTWHVSPQHYGFELASGR